MDIIIYVCEPRFAAPLDVTGDERLLRLTLVILRLFTG